MESTIRSPRSALRWPKRGSALTVRAMHSVVECISDCITTLFWCTDRVGKARGSAFGAVATLTTSAAAASGARNIESPPDARILNRVREERHSQMHLASTDVANIRRLWCLGNIMGNAAAWHPRSNFGLAAGLRPGGTLLPRAALTSVSPNRQRD